MLGERVQEVFVCAAVIVFTVMGGTACALIAGGVGGTDHPRETLLRQAHDAAQEASGAPRETLPAVPGL